MSKLTVELLKGRVRYFYHVKASNGEIMTTSQKYFNKGNAKRAAKKSAKLLDAKFKEVK